MASLDRRASGEGCGVLLLSLPQRHSQARQDLLRDTGFIPIRIETEWSNPLHGHRLPRVTTVHDLVSVSELDPDQAAALDNRIGADIPGTELWHGSGADIQESLNDPEFDPKLYLVARHPQSGSLDGLIRVWNRTPQPPLGCLGVTRPWRRTRLASRLIQEVSERLLARGIRKITTRD